MIQRMRCVKEAARCFRVFRLSLASRAKETRPSALHEPLYNPCAPFAQTGFARTAINGECVLKISRRAVDPGEIAQG